VGDDGDVAQLHGKGLLGRDDAPSARKAVGDSLCCDAAS
jgi:hypothetical protein